MNRHTLHTGAAIALATISAALGFRLAPAFSGTPCSGPFTIEDRDIPLTINEPGLYCVTEDLTGDPNTDGIVVNADNVVIDLQGYSLEGNGDAVAIKSSGKLGVTVKNGKISFWRTGALELLGVYTSLLDLEIASCGAATLGRQSLVERVTVTFSTGSTALVLGSRSVVRDSTVTHGSGDGFDLGTGGLVERCATQSNAGVQFKLSTECRIIDSVATGGTDGIRANLHSSVIGCHVEDATRICIDVEAGSIVRDCTIVNRDQGIGIEAEFGSRVSDCTVTACETGFSLGSKVIATDCVARLNTGNGFEPSLLSGGAFRLQGCIAANSGQNGIVAPGESEILCSTSTHNTLAGIHIDGNGARVESNRLLNNGKGIEIVGQDNLVIRNSLADNVTAFAIPPGNTRGPLLVANDWLKSGNPWANFNLTFP